MNGCQHHSDCFTCPFRDCILTTMEAIRLERKAKKAGRVKKGPDAAATAVKAHKK